MATVNKDFRVKNGLVVEGTTATVNGNDILTTASNTGSLPEGTNLYFTDARVLNTLNSTSDSIVLGGSKVTVNSNINANYDLNVSGTATFDGAIVGIDTSDVTEGANLYFTNSRAIAAVENANFTSLSADTVNISELTINGGAGTITAAGTLNLIGGLPPQANGSTILTEANLSSTDALSEGSTNLYFTDARAVSAVDGSTVTALTASENFLLDDGANHTAGIQIAENGTTSIYSNNGALDLSSNHSDVYLNASTDIYLNVDEQQGAVYINQEAVATQTYVNTAVSNLVDSAPGALDTLNELAAALGDDANFSTTVTTAIGEKVAKAGDTMTGYLTLHANPESNLHAATKQYVDGAITTGINAIDTDAIEEGSTNLYYTNERVADLLRNASLTNIQITGGGLGETLSIVAENGVADSDTDDLAEGSTNLYFTDARALSAIVDETIEPRIVTLKSTHPDNYSKTYILQQDNFEGGPQNLGTIAGSAAKIIVTAVNKNTGDIEVTEVLAARAGGNIYVTEYANVTTGNDVGSVTVTDNGGGLMQLNYTGANFDMLSVTAHVTDLIVDLTN